MNPANSDVTLTTQEGLPRLVEGLLAAVGLLVFFPFLALAALLIAFTSRGPVLFRQQRMGRNGRTFTLFKLRTMRVQHIGPQITAAGDARVTRIGKLLRKTKFDEMPELWNVLAGDMSLVGARPEVPHYVDLHHPDWRRVLRSRPGITDPVTMRLRNEESVLATAKDPEQFYLEILQPYKLKGYVEYLSTRTWWDDIEVIFKTIVAVALPNTAPPPTREEILTYINRTCAPAHENLFSGD